MRREDIRRTELKAQEEAMLAEMVLREQMAEKMAEEIEARNAELAKDARARMFWVYQTRDLKEVKVKDGKPCLRVTF